MNKNIHSKWRSFLKDNEDAIVKKWSAATGMSEKKLREGISRRDFLRGAGAVAASAVTGDAFADSGDTGFEFENVPWSPADEDPRWEDSSFTGLKGYAAIDPDFVQDNELLMGGIQTASQYKDKLEGYTIKSLEDGLIGSGATAIHGDPSAGRGSGLDVFKLKDNRGLQGKPKLPLSWSLMYQEYYNRMKEK